MKHRHRPFRLGGALPGMELYGYEGRGRRQIKHRAAGLALLLVLLWATCSAAEAQETAVILADPADPYHTLAREMAAAEGLPLVESLDEALARE
ncbi:MAG: hypothetical protein RBU35_08315, partial [Anaerolineae bacterium]|nr:hypothetical protein [Anaerolineae bacterium]